MFLFIIFFIIVGIPAIVVGLMYDGSSVDAMPVHLYSEDANATDLMYEELHQRLDEIEDDLDANLTYEITQDMVNIAIFNMIRGDDESAGINPSYLPSDTCVEASCKYVMEEVVRAGGTDVHMRILGVWVEFEEDMLTMNAALEAQYGDGMTFKSTIKVALELEDDAENGQYRLELDRLRIGNLPLPKGLFGRLAGLFGDIENTVEETLPFGDFNARELRYTVDKDSLIDYIQSTEEGDGMVRLASEVLGIVFEEGLLNFKLDEAVFRFTFRMAVLRNDSDTDIPAYLHDMRNADEIDETVFDYEQHLQTRFEQFVFNMALTNQTYFTITERTFNKILYYEMDGFEATQTTFEYEDGDGNPREILVGLEALWFEFRVDEDVYINIKGLFNIGGVKSMLVIRADNIDDTQPGMYILEFTEVTMGREPGKEYLDIDRLEAFKAAMRDIGDFEFGYVNEDGNLVIDTNGLTDLLDDGTVQGTITVNDVEIVHQGIRVHVAATDQTLQDALDAFSNAINDAFTDEQLLTNLSGVLDTEDGGAEQATYEAVQDIQAKLDNDEDITEEDVEALFENFDELSKESQDAFMDVFEGLVDESVLDDFKENFQN